MAAGDEPIAMRESTLAEQGQRVAAVLETLTRLEERMDRRFDILEGKYLRNSAWTLAAQAVTLAVVLGLLVTIFVGILFS